MPVTRPYPRTAPCAVVCRGDGDQICASIDIDRYPHGGGVAGFGDDLPAALRDLADSLEKEVEYEGEQVTEITDPPQEPRVVQPQKRMDWAGIRRDYATDLNLDDGRPARVHRTTRRLWG
jgi:hypothetical protein